jgi:hypothetical protein
MANVIQVAIIGFTDHGIDGHHLLISRLRERPVENGLHARRHRQRVRQYDGSLDLAELRHLAEAR